MAEIENRMTPSPQGQRLQALNALRGIAAMSVAIDHTILLAAQPQPDSTLFYVATFLGCFGVGAFFLLSGFVIYLSLEKTRPLQFLIHRVLRIYPVIVTAIVLRLISQLLMGVRFWDSNTIKIALLNASLFGNLFIPIDRNIEPIVWSLAIEVKFYLMMAAVFYITRGRQSAVIKSISYIAVFLGILNTKFPPLSSPARLDMALAASCLPILLLGTTACLYYKEKINASTFAILAALLLLAFSLTPLTDNVSFHKNFSAWIISFFVFSACIFSMKFSASLSNAGLLFLGEISYPLYAVHSLVVEAMIHTTPHATPSSVILRSLVISVGLAYFINKTIESPSQSWIKSRTRQSN